MKSRTMMATLTVLCGVALWAVFPPAPARATPTVKKAASKAFSSAEVGFQGTVVGGGGDLTGTFLGAVLTLQGAKYKPVAGVFQFGAGAGMDEDPSDPDATRTKGQFWMALGARVRPLAFGRSARTGRLDLFVGPLVGVLANHGVVALTVGAEAGVGLHLGRVRLSLALHGGYADLLHQEVPDRLSANWYAGGQLSCGVVF